jgi:dihydrofolate reductase
LAGKAELDAKVLDAAVAATGAVVVGGASVCSQAVAAGLADQLLVHVAPVLVGGTRRFEQLGNAPIALQVTEVVDSPQSDAHLPPGPARCRVTVPLVESCAARRPGRLQLPA